MGGLLIPSITLCLLLLTHSRGDCRHPGVTGGDTRWMHGCAPCQQHPWPPPSSPPARGALLGQLGLEHSRASAWAPRHSAQPWAATLHLRVRCCVPLAQVTEQRLQAPHSSHCPSTAGTSERSSVSLPGRRPLGRTAPVLPDPLRNGSNRQMWRLLLCRQQQPAPNRAPDRGAGTRTGPHTPSRCSYSPIALQRPA